MNNSTLNPLKFREIILNTQEPVVLKNFSLNWICFRKGLEEWCKEFDNTNSSAISFERVSKQDSREPQWERKRQPIKMTTSDFLREHSKNCDYWSALNYKRRHEIPEACTKGIDFSAFGFPKAADDATLWLCSEGANTPCHYDSYGCNIVVQVFGNKSWLLFPPNTPLTTTRIPYEESSVYCKENFYAPSDKKYHEKLKHLAHHIILEPNDILIVPKHWWHYVEALNISLSVNVWIPLKCDLEQQIEECIVKYLIESFVNNCSIAEQTFIMNPNQLAMISTKDELFKILKYLTNESLTHKTEDAKKQTIKYNYSYLHNKDVEKLLEEFKYVTKVSLLSGEEFDKYLKTNSSRCGRNIKCDKKEFCLDPLEDILINSVSNPFTIQVIKKEFLQRYQLENEEVEIK